MVEPNCSNERPERKGMKLCKFVEHKPWISPRKWKESVLRRSCKVAGLGDGLNAENEGEG